MLELDIKGAGGRGVFIKILSKLTLELFLIEAPLNQRGTKTGTALRKHKHVLFCSFFGKLVGFWCINNFSFTKCVDMYPINVVWVRYE